MTSAYLDLPRRRLDEVLRERERATSNSNCMVSDMTETEHLARLMIAEIRSALSRGTKHYDKAGNLLADELSILTALMEDGEITFEPNKEGKS